MEIARSQNDGTINFAPSGRIDQDSSAAAYRRADGRDILDMEMTLSAVPD